MRSCKPCNARGEWRKNLVTIACASSTDIDHSATYGTRPGKRVAKCNEKLQNCVVAVFQKNWRSERLGLIYQSARDMWQHASCLGITRKRFSQGGLQSNPNFLAHSNEQMWTNRGLIFIMLATPIYLRAKVKFLKIGVWYWLHLNIWRGLGNCLDFTPHSMKLENRNMFPIFGLHLNSQEKICHRIIWINWS